MFSHLNEQNTLKTEKFHENMTQMSSKLVNIPEWAKGFNDTLFDVIVGEIRVENRFDRTISIRQMIAVLENTPIFKDNNEKMIYLEKI